MKKIALVSALVAFAAMPAFAAEEHKDASAPAAAPAAAAPVAAAPAPAAAAPAAGTMAAKEITLKDGTIAKVAADGTISTSKDGKSEAVKAGTVLELKDGSKVTAK
jgi:hypothetical protein